MVVWYFHYQNWLVVLIAATPEGYHEHGSFRIPDVTEPSWSHPVITGGRLYLREQGPSLVLRRSNAVKRLHRGNAERKRPRDPSQPYLANC